MSDARSAEPTERPNRLTMTGSFMQFALVGIVGFLLDGGILTVLMVHAGWTPLQARAVSFSAAVTTTWWLNRRYAFRDRGSLSRHREYSAYVAIQAVGAGINLSVFFVCLWAMPSLVHWPLIPLAAGAGFALVFNFLAARYTVYRSSRTPRALR